MESIVYFLFGICVVIGLRMKFDKDFEKILQENKVIGIGIGILFFTCSIYIIGINYKSKTTSTNKTSELKINEVYEESKWTLIDEKDKFGDLTGKKIIQYKTKGTTKVLGKDYVVDITILITKYKIGVLENFENETGYFLEKGGKWDLRNGIDKDLKLGIIDSWDNGYGTGVIKYSFDGNNGQYKKLIRYLKESKTEIRNIIIDDSETRFSINPDGLNNLLETSKEVLSDGLTKEEKSVL